MRGAVSISMARGRDRHGAIARRRERGQGWPAGLSFEQARQLDAGLTDKAITYQLMAGRQAERQSANQEAIRVFQRGLDILHGLPDFPADATGGRAADRVDLPRRSSTVTRHQRRDACMIDLAAVPAGRRHPYAVHRPGWALAVLWRVRRFQDGTGIGEADPRHCPDGPGDRLSVFEAYRAVGGPLFSLGRLREARVFFEQGAAPLRLRRTFELRTPTVSAMNPAVL